MAEKFSFGTTRTDGKTWFGLEKYKENQPNYQCLPLLTVLPLNFFMGVVDRWSFMHFIFFWVGGMVYKGLPSDCFVRYTESELHCQTYTLTHPSQHPFPLSFFLVSSSCKAVRSLWLWLSHAASLNPDSARLTLAPTSISVIVHLKSVRFVKETLSRDYSTFLVSYHHS